MSWGSFLTSRFGHRVRKCSFGHHPSRRRTLTSSRQGIFWQSMSSWGKSFWLSDYRRFYASTPEAPSIPPVPPPLPPPSTTSTSSPVDEFEADFSRLSFSSDPKLAAEDAAFERQQQQQQQEGEGTYVPPEEEVARIMAIHARSDRDFPDRDWDYKDHDTLLNSYEEEVRIRFPKNAMYKPPPAPPGRSPSSDATTSMEGEEAGVETAVTDIAIAMEAFPIQVPVDDDRKWWWYNLPAIERTLKMYNVELHANAPIEIMMSNFKIEPAFRMSALVYRGVQKLKSYGVYTLKQLSELSAEQIVQIAYAKHPLLPALPVIVEQARVWLQYTRMRDDKLRRARPSGMPTVQAALPPRSRLDFTTATATAAAPPPPPPPTPPPKKKKSKSP